LMDRANSIYEKGSWTSELHVKFILWASGYFLQDINRASKSRPAKRSTKKESSNKAYLTYIQGTTDRISRLLQKHDIHMIQKSLNKMVSRFKSTKDTQLPTQKSGVYKIPGSCGKMYIGQTGCHISTRISEYIRDTRLENQWSAVAELSTATEHGIDFDKTEVIANFHSHHPPVISEATEITKHPHNFNCEETYRLSKARLHLFSPKPPTQPPLSLNIT
jgi:hypothetical protein